MGIFVAFSMMRLSLNPGQNNATLLRVREQNETSCSTGKTAMIRNEGFDP